MEIPDLPDRTFAAGDEPARERVNSYHKPKSIDAIMSSLQRDEVEYIRRSSFGRLVLSSEKPSFSGSFGQFLITRMLKINKKHEIWILFAGRPIWISLREFAIVTGLPCRRYPKAKKKKANLVKQKPYWGDLFGLLPSVTVESVLTMLKKKKVTDKDIRLKYAFLALTASVLCPSSHKPKIIKEHAELIRDLDEFLLYPWGRLAFDKIISSINSKDVVALAQSTVAVKGFVQAIQLVMVEAVPALTEVVQVDDITSSSESEREADVEEDDSGEVAEKTTGGEDDTYNPEGAKESQTKLSLSPSHAREIDEACKVVVNSIIADDVLIITEENDFGWSDEEEDERVDNMLELINGGHCFKREMFRGGLTTSDLELIRTERKEGKERKEKDKSQDTTDCPSNQMGDADGLDRVRPDPIMIADKVAKSLRENLSAMESTVKQIGAKADAIEGIVERAINRKITTMQDAIVRSILSFLEKSVTAAEYVEHAGDEEADGASRPSQVNQPHSTQSPATDIIGSVMGELRSQSVAEEPIGELGRPLGQIDQQPNTRSQEPIAEQGRPLGQIDQQPNTRFQELVTAVTTSEDETLAEFRRKSKRHRSQPAQLCDYDVGPAKRKFARVAEPLVLGSDPTLGYERRYSELLETLQPETLINMGNGGCLNTRDIREIGERSKFMTITVADALMHYTADVFSREFPRPKNHKVDFFDTKFAPVVLKQHSKFMRTAAKDKRNFKWPDVVVDYFGMEDEEPPTFDRIYFPFNVDKQHWVGVCVDKEAASVEVLDCHTAMRTDRVTKQDFAPLAQMMPYLLKRDTQVMPGDVLRAEEPYNVIRVKGIPQNVNPKDYGVTSLLLMQSNAIAAGTDANASDRNRCKPNPRNLP